LNSRNWAKAIERFRDALKKWPENPEFRKNLERAEAEKKNQFNRDATRGMLDTFRVQEEKKNSIQDMKRDLAAGENAQNLENMRRELEKEAHLRLIVQKERDEYEKMNAQWLKRQQEFIRQAATRDKKWKNEVLASIKDIRVPSPVFTPKTLDDLNPGDILLIAPDDSPTARGIVRADPLYRAIDYFSGGNVSKPGWKKGRVSHAMTVVKAVNGEILFLDHTRDPGSRILTRKEYIREYGRRGMLVARPQAKVDGRELWLAAREAALKKKSDYGFFGDDVVCSERAAIVVAKATKLPLQNEHHRLGKRLGPVDITPSDFFDYQHVGKYFVISATPILPAEKRSKP